MTFRSRNPKRIPEIALDERGFSGFVLPDDEVHLRRVELHREAPVELAEAVELDLQQPHQTPSSIVTFAETGLSLLVPSTVTVPLLTGNHRDARALGFPHSAGLVSSGGGGVLVEELLEADRERALGDRDLAVDVAVGVGECASSRSFSRRCRIFRTKKPRIVFSAPTRRRSALCSKEDRSTTLSAANRSPTSARKASRSQVNSRAPGEGEPGDDVGSGAGKECRAQRVEVLDGLGAEVDRLVDQGLAGEGDGLERDRAG